MFVLPENLEEVRQITMVFLSVAAVSSTVFTVLWAFWPWYSTSMGRIFMLQSVSLSLALDLTLFFRFYFPVDHLYVILFVNFFVFGGLATSTLLMMLVMLRKNVKKRRKEPVDLKLVS